VTVTERGGSATIDAGGYRVIIGAGLRHYYASTIAENAPAHHYSIITDDMVGSHYAPALAEQLARHGRVSTHHIPAGEAYKSRESWSRLTDAMIAAGCGRDTTVVALGGGVVGDLAGFVAATFMRGVPVVQCPTSLLAMIDASIGGKTGVDTTAGKNLVGAFHPPAVVLIDVETLATLPPAHRRAGLAEAIKHGVIADAVYFERIDADVAELVEGRPKATLGCVARSVEIKSAIVRADPREWGVRRTLNFGHTLGHALEHVSGYSLLHGEAVGIGMHLEARLAERMGLAPAGTAERIREVLRRAELPAERPRSLVPEALLEATRRDKKTRGGAVTYSLPAGIGSMAGEERDWSIEVGDALVREVLA
jgi:3-dehydroquinate synthase